MSKHTHSLHTQDWINGQVASIGYRYSIWQEFEKRVQDESRLRGFNVPKVVHRHPYSFQDTKNPDKEELILWQPNKKCLTQTKPGIPLKIEYKYTDRTKLDDFNQYYDVLTGPGKHHKAEDSEETFYGNYDEFETYRAVYRLEEALAPGDYEGIITNPPYPAIFGHNTTLRYLRSALVAVASLALIPLAMAFGELLRRQR
ncbi:hypothetical protein GCM10022409_22180 [Hymenobacter glaciei]|uniref:Site-specific DNA-methyltransferase (adenine-specific) n=1 Tax=Hymenobacter glaciei TaxID=877209 RepID=A0ABP7U6I6_9BACT